ncbi:amiloride-sensitive amine oxidase [copper-containing]-like isoform X2 [Xyrauchen texanus]|uniref:amiloride-sensitive amine oxidase [copper-containing]-like isoform X2 n=1 Tax=Xyrauchen texanus TaxID=154827 RepID=UPI0022427407|nr:amiloride-sensitive amine oxidase [copper-containing]-like isoform X2 [Xyrauchen texanus]
MQFFVMLLLASLDMATAALRSREWAHHGALMFADLTPREMNAVRDYLYSCSEMGLTSARAKTLKKNSILLMELHVPRKHEALHVLDRGQAKPPRQARVVVQFGNQVKPNVTEYIIGPLPFPSSYHIKSFKGDQLIRFESRPVSSVEYKHLNGVLEKVAAKTNKILYESTGFTYGNCTDRCLTFSDIAPRGLASGERRTWVMLQKFVEGYYIHPIGFEVLINHKDLDHEKWTVDKVWYNEQYFDSVEELVEKYEKGTISKLKLPEHDEQDLFSTYIPRGHMNTRTNIHGAKLVEPQGPRYQVDGNFVEYAGWSFAYHVRSSAGLQIFDLRFNGERIAYEIGLQEAIAFYSGDTPAAMQTKYIDAGWSMGTLDYELAPGIDCPEIAYFVDLYHYYDTDKPVRYKNALCIFEMTTGLPLRRHFNSNFQGGYNFFGGLESHVLVIRTTSTVYNYDYIWDFIFYQNGVMESRVSATGYIHATFFTENGLNYGTRVYNYVLGRDNSFESIELKYVNFTNPWSPEHTVLQSKLHKTQHETERSAAFRFGKNLPKYLHFYNPNQNNKWGHKRGYRIQYNSHANSVLPRGWREENGISWSRYPLAVTRHKDSEVSSSSIYTQNDPWEPLVTFENFIRNNENIVNQDLVAWVTVGFLHIPHSEDIPNTATPGNAVGFFLRPFNFFDEDPSLASHSTIIVRPDEKGQPKVQRWTPEVVGHCVSDKPFFYNGTYSSV